MELIKFNGTNEKLFSRVVVENCTSKTTLIVPETHSALVFFNGEMLQTLSKGRYKLADIVNVSGDALLEIIFVSKTAKLKLLWGTPNKFTLFDPAPYKVGLSGEFEVQVADPRKCFLYLVGAEEDLTADALQERLTSRLVSEISLALSKYVKENSLKRDQIFIERQKIADSTLKSVSTIFNNEYGIKVFSLSILNVIFDENISASEKVCPNCHTALLADAKFCFNCGEKLSGKICSKCHFENVNGAKFCANCGEKF